MSIFLYNLFRVWIGELKMKKKYTIMLYVIALLLSFVIILGGTYAYFAVTLNTAGNDKKLNIVTEDLGSIKWVGTKVYTSDSLLPGEIGLQTFTIEKNSATGKGIYEIDLNGIVDEAFNNDIEITLYKTTDTTKNNVSVTSGNTSMTGTGTLNVAKEDTLNITGTPEKVYGPKAFKERDPYTILEQVDFDNSTFQKTTYYLVYHYKNNGNQNSQQGKSFSGEINIQLILESEKLKNIIFGDVNGDKSVDNFDSVLVYNATIGLEELTDKQKIRADVDGNGKITKDDSQMIYDYFVGKVEKFPIEDEIE